MNNWKCLVNFKYFIFSWRDKFIIEYNYRWNCVYMWIFIKVFYLVFVCFFISIDRIFYYYYSREGGIRIIWVDKFCFVFVKRFYFYFNERLCVVSMWKKCYIFKCIIYLFLLFDILVWNVFCFIFMICII